MSETERPTPSGSGNPLEDAAALTDTMFDAAESLLKAQHELTQALLAGPRDASGPADEEFASTKPLLLSVSLMNSVNDARRKHGWYC